VCVEAIAEPSVRLAVIAHCNWDGVGVLRRHSASDGGGRIVANRTTDSISLRHCHR
jgi:hypothetical protein